MTRRRLLIAGWLLVLGLSASLPLSALFHGIVHVGTGDMTVRAPLTRPVISIGSDVVLLHGSRSIVVTILGDIQLSGRARDDLVALDGRIYLAPGSKVDGDVLSLLGGIYKAPGVTAMGRLGGA